MYNKEQDTEYLNSLAEYYPKTEDELKLVVFKILSLPCAQSLDRTQLLFICKINRSKFNQKQALKAVEEQIQEVEKELEKTPHPIIKKKSENLHIIHEALETCFVNYR